MVPNILYRWLITTAEKLHGLFDKLLWYIIDITNSLKLLTAFSTEQTTSKTEII